MQPKQNTYDVYMLCHVDDFMQQRHNSSASAMEFHLFCVKPSVYSQWWMWRVWFLLPADPMMIYFLIHGSMSTPLRQPPLAYVTYLYCHRHASVCFMVNSQALITDVTEISSVLPPVCMEARVECQCSDCSVHCLLCVFVCLCVGWEVGWNWPYIMFWSNPFSMLS